jgi:hypothetical protein
MKTTLATLSIVTVLVSASSAKADSYLDATGDFTGGNSDLDISSVTVNNDAATLTFTINLAGNPMNATWYNYYAGVSKDLFGGVGGNLNATGGWGKDIQMSAGGMDYFIGSYPGFGGYSLLTWNGSSWSSAGGAASQNSTSVIIPVALSSLGLSAGDRFKFDVWVSTSGGDTVLDALSDSTARSWNSSAFDTGANALSYTVATVPEPGALALLGLAGLIMVRRCKAIQ